MMRDFFVMLSESSLARSFTMHAPGARSVARRFVAGETIEEGIATARALNRAGMKVTLDYLGESVSSRDEARQAADTYLRLIERIAAEKLDANVSLKLTQMGQDIDETFLYDNVTRVFDAARLHDMFVRLDMESSAYTQRTIDFFRHAWEQGYTNVGIVLQSYMRRSEQDVTLANQLGARVRLCKGAYVEPPEVAFQEKTEVDASFVALMKMLLSDGTYPGIATHDEKMINATRAWSEERQIPRDAFEFQMLYGVRRDLQEQLQSAGYRVRVYVPFGGAWYPYLMRRMAERPANVFFIVKAVLRESPLGFMFNGR